MHQSESPQSPTDACPPDQAARKLSRLECAVLEFTAAKREASEAEAEFDAAKLLARTTGERSDAAWRKVRMAERNLVDVAGEDGIEGITHG